MLSDGTTYVCEIQLNHMEMIAAKKEAHVYYEKVREELPALRQATTVDAEKLEAFIVGRLSTSSLDAAVEALLAKAEGLFLYMLSQHLESLAKNGHEIRFENLDSLPAGLGEVYAVNFMRAFPKGQVDPAWTEAKPLVELIAAAREPITVAMAAALLGWDDRQKGGVIEKTALLFPERDGKFHVFHKTIVDWLTGEITEGSSIREPSAEFKVQRKDDADSFNLLETRQGEAMALSEEADGVVRDGSTIRMKDGVGHSMRRAQSRLWQCVGRGLQPVHSQGSCTTLR